MLTPAAVAQQGIPKAVSRQPHGPAARNDGGAPQRLGSGVLQLGARHQDGVGQDGRAQLGGRAEEEDVARAGAPRLAIACRDTLAQISLSEAAGTGIGAQVTVALQEPAIAWTRRGEAGSSALLA